ncbi:MAG: hypothetical protein JST00_39465 [Deltaproteobacteria bacterium]|nr:hypothetical protein [Deltaproteobacteria bacterium]
MASVTSAVTPPSPDALGTPRARTALLAELALVGGATLFLFPLAWALRKAVGLSDAELAAGALTFYAAFVVNDPHFSVTYLLFYRDVRRRAFGADVPRLARARFIVAGVVVPVALLGWSFGAIATGSAQALGWMVQLMYLLVGWHYAKQGFGVMTVLSARRGQVLSPRERAVILFHCYAGWAFAWANPATPAGEFEERGVVYSGLAHPRWLEVTTGLVLAGSLALLAWVLVARWRRERSTMPMGPLACLLVTVWLWTIFSSLDPVVRYLVPALHSIQYLYFVWLMRRNEAKSEEGPPTFGRPVAVRLGFLAVSAIALAWLLFHGVPGYLDGVLVAKTPKGHEPGPLGEMPFFAAFYVMVNIHHYFMDTVIWRRDNPDTRFLRA